MKKTLWLVLISLLVIPVYQAQQPTPTLTAQDLYNWTHTLYFPQQVDFTLFTLRRESDISTLRLTLSYQGADPITIELDTVVVEFTESGALYSYTWQIPPDLPPPLFSTVRYRWDITTTEGQPVIIADDFVFEDTRITWEQSGDLESRVDIYHPRGQVNPNTIRSGIRQTYDLLFVDTSDKPTYKLLVYPDGIPIGCERNEDGDPIFEIPVDDGVEEIDCDLELANRIYEEGNFIVFNQSQESSIQQNLIELIVEAYYTEQWDDADVPAWFLRGLQSFYDPRPDIESLRLAQQRSRSDDLLSLDELATRPDDETTRAMWSAQSTGLVVYLADTIGVNDLFEFADNIGSADSFASAYEDAVGTELDTLLLLWQDWLFLSSSENDYEYHPYLPDTATPTVTPTATNTPTATFTPSITPDVTSTPRPTFTLIPPTATITPLPAQSFSVQPTDIPPTPIPAEAEQVQLQADDGLTTRLAIGGAVIGVLLILLFFVLRQR